MNPDDLELRVRTTGAQTARLAGPDGAVCLVASPGARMVGLWTHPAAPNLLWTNSQATSDRAFRGGWKGYKTGGLGGDRIWLGPEHRWFWDGPPQRDLSNWRVPETQDPGNYALCCEPGRARLTQSIELEPGTTARVSRSFAFLPPRSYLHAHGARLKETRQLRLCADSQVDFWNITQVRVGTHLIVPTFGAPTPSVSYEATRGVFQRHAVLAEDHFRWQVVGDLQIKGSLPASNTRGQIATLERLDPDTFALVIRGFSPRPLRRYDDALFPDQVACQCVQWWDGHGYGEIEIHSPTLFHKHRQFTETHLLEAWTGPASIVAAIAGQRLRCQLPPELFRRS